MRHQYSTSSSTTVFQPGYHIDFVKTAKNCRNVVLLCQSAERAVFSPNSCRGITPLPSTVGDTYCKDPKYTTLSRVGNGQVPNLKDKNICYENPICLVIPKLLHSIKSKHTISRIYSKGYYKTIKIPSASTQSFSAVQLCSSKLHLPLQTS